ncbi:MAG: hypothetical protein FJ399_00905 [Verrucomicrobia bacterium]|nr:hypothetical protein [Verrucomicrobiota bacterium]
MALETLVAQEAASVRSGDYATLGRLQTRAEPLIRFLGAHAVAVEEAGLRDRVARWLKCRQENGRRLQAAMAQTTARIEELGAGRSRLTRMAPVYGRASRAAPQFRMIG